MGHYSRKPYEGERAGAGKHKVMKEMGYHRIKNDSPAKQSIADRKKRLKELQHAFEQQRDPIKREQFYLQWTNLAASCPLEVFRPEDVHGIERLSSLGNEDTLRGLHGNNPGLYSGFQFLPLHHLVKLLDKPTEQIGDRYVHLLGITKDGPEDVATINLRALEVFLLNFSAMVLPGQSLSLEIDRKAIAFPYYDHHFISTVKNTLPKVKRMLETKGIRASTPYFAGKVYSGNNKVASNLLLSTEPRSYIQEGARQDVLVSMVRTVD